MTQLDSIELPHCDCECDPCTDGYCLGCLDLTCLDPGCACDPNNPVPQRDLLSEQVLLVVPW
jgi:hypothetical protein